MTQKRTRGPALWGPGELTAGLGVTRQTLRNWRARPDFPKPIAELSIGPVWDPAAVKAWHRKADLSPGPKTTTKAALGGKAAASRKGGRK